MNEIFSWRRFGLLLRNDIVSRYRALLMHSAVLAAVILVSSMMINGFGQPEPAGDFYFYAFPALLFLWGMIVASAAFNDLHDKHQNEAYLLLPASDVEKTIARLLPVTIGFFVYLLAYLTLVSWTVETINLILFGVQDRPFDPFDANVSLLVGHYVVAQSLFFLGAAWFRKAHFWKTSLAIFAINSACGAFALLLAWILFEPYRDGFGVSIEGDGYELYLANKSLIDGALLGVKLTYYFVLPPLCWFVAWLRVKETQVSHGV